MAAMEGGGGEVITSHSEDAGIETIVLCAYMEEGRSGGGKDLPCCTRLRVTVWSGKMFEA
jgi:hypothetical protein